MEHGQFVRRNRLRWKRVSRDVSREALQRLFRLRGAPVRAGRIFLIDDEFYGRFLHLRFRGGANGGV